jgi:diguanylate cyclase (GGDEF)-like protein
VKDLADVANHAKSIFLSKMSHELRTPLNAVIGFSEILLEDDDFDGQNGDKQADLERINSAGKHLLSLVTDVLDLSKIESDFVELKIEKFDLNEMVREVIANVQPLVVENGNKLVVECSSNLGIVSTDQTKLRQAALNLMSNAAKFTQDGAITLSVERQKSPAGDWIEIRVRDSGIGIAQSDIGCLFQNFGQATRATSSKYGGTGLGLALSQTICALMGGGISATSELGHGSCFTIRVPAWTNTLTGLPNRRAFDEFLPTSQISAMETGEPFSILLLDIDRFKQFNDDFGHAVGDQVLRLMANALRERVREQDMPARYGGEEFIAVLPGADLAVCEAVAERIRQSVEKCRISRRSTSRDHRIDRRRSI